MITFDDLKAVLAQRVVCTNDIPESKMDDMLTFMAKGILQQFHIDARHIEQIDYLDYYPNGKSLISDPRESRRSHVLPLAQTFELRPQKMYVGNDAMRMLCYVDYQPDLKRLFIWKPYGDEFERR